MPDPIINRRPKGKHNIQDPRHPNELLCERPRSEKVAPGDDERDAEHEDEEDDGVGVEREGVAGVVDAAAAKVLVAAVSLQRKPRDGSEA